MPNIPTRAQMNSAILAGAQRLRASAESKAVGNDKAFAALDSVDLLIDRMVETSESVHNKQQIREQLGQFRRSFNGAETAPEIRKAYEKLRNLNLDNTVERVEKGGKIPTGHFTVMPQACDIPNFQAINDTYSRGGQPDQDGLNFLAQSGVKSRIDLRGGDRQNQWFPPAWSSMKTFEVNVTDFEAPSIETVETFLDIVDNPANQPVFVHCKAGIGRTGVMTACWNIAHGMTADQALAAEEINSYNGSLRQEDFVREFEVYWHNKRPQEALLAA